MPQPSGIPGIMEPDGPGPLNPRMEEQQAKMRNMDRQKQIVADTQKLLDLATQLKTDVDKSNKDTLSLDVIRKADEIEKLAKQVKEKMKGS
jgi:nitric oxide reductase activation protein